MPLNPLLPQYKSYTIIDLPDSRDDLVAFLTLIGDIDSWPITAISKLLTDNPRTIYKRGYHSTFYRGGLFGPHYVYTAAEITAMLTPKQPVLEPADNPPSPHIYRRRG